MLFMITLLNAATSRKKVHSDVSYNIFFLNYVLSQTANEARDLAICPRERTTKVQTYA